MISFKTSKLWVWPFNYEITLTLGKKSDNNFPLNGQQSCPSVELQLIIGEGLHTLESYPSLYQVTDTSNIFNNHNNNQFTLESASQSAFELQGTS